MTNSTWTRLVLGIALSAATVGCGETTTAPVTPAESSAPASSATTEPAKPAETPAPTTPPAEAPK